MCLFVIDSYIHVVGYDDWIASLCYHELVTVLQCHLLITHPILEDPPYSVIAGAQSGK